MTKRHNHNISVDFDANLTSLSVSNGTEKFM